ncbi:MAG: PRC-barrel domain-containing protein, partial [Phycisphaerae bacterium]
MIRKAFDRSKGIAVASVLVAAAMAATAATQSSSQKQQDQQDKEMMDTGSATSTQYETQQQKEQKSQQQWQQKQQSQQAGQYTPELFDANEIVGTEVTNAKDETLGTVEDLILDTAQDQVAFAVIAPETEGVDLSILTGQELHAVPFSALQLQQQGQDQAPKVTLNIEQNRLKESPTFQSDQYPQVNDPYWQNAHSFFSQQISQNQQQMGQGRMQGQSWQTGQTRSQQQQQQDRMTRTTQQTGQEAREFGRETSEEAQQLGRQTEQ